MNGLRVVRNEIFHIRGDTGEILLDLFSRGVAIQQDDTCDIVFTVKKSYDDDDIVMQKCICDNRITFLTEDTADLPVGDYVYDIEVRIHDADGGPDQVATVVRNKYHLQPDVTR